MALFLLIAVSLLSIVLGTPSGLTRNYTNCKMLSPQPKYLLYWNVVNTQMQFAVQVQSSGWVGFGFSADGTMDSGGSPPVGSDLFVGWIDGGSCSNGCIYDYSTLKHDTPVLDASQDVQLISASSEEGMLTLEFNRALSTGDTVADRVITPSSLTWIIFSTNTDSIPNSNTVFTKHTYSSSTRVQFSGSLPSVCPTRPDDISISLTVNGSLYDFDSYTFQNSLATTLGIPANRLVITGVTEQDPPFCPECTQLEFKFPRYNVPAQVTTYACVGFNFPTTNEQIIRFDAFVDNDIVLHHMVLFYLPASSPPWSSTPTDCSNMPANASPMYAWAPGGQPVIVPDQAGFAIGSAVGITKAVLQFHYNNPTSASTYYDSSSILMYLTTNLRPQNAALMFLGPQFSSIQVPGGHSSYHQAATCGTLSILPSQGITVFAHMGHAHKLGREIWTEHIAPNGTRIGYLSYIPNYDFAAQKFVSDNVIIKNGESLRTHCMWDSTVIPPGTTTYGGESTSNEMCLDLILYYPMVTYAGNPVQWCGPSVDTPGCDCNMQSVPACVDRPECVPAGSFDACYKAHGVNCAQCVADTGNGCKWCDSPLLAGCLKNGVCESITGAAGTSKTTCSQQTPCNVNHAGDCSGCQADTANNCRYCSNTPICMDVDAGLAVAEGVCAYISGSLLDPGTGSC